MARTGRHKLIYRSRDVSELYDLDADPRELHNVHGSREYAGVQSELERRLLDWYVRTADVVPVDEDPRGLPSRA